jgi:NADH-quinone oxidoreductase subunit L
MAEGIFAFVPAIVALPFVSFLLALAAGKYLPKRGAISGIVAMFGSLVISLLALLSVAGVIGEPGISQEVLYQWTVGQGTFDLHFGILVDQLSALMLVIVSIISLLVHVFSLGYMNDEGETGLPRYYAELGFFSGSMLAFVMADNLLMAFMFFELVGLASYLLIGFWFRGPSPPSAAKKAFLVTRFGDYFFLIGVIAVFATFGTAGFTGSEGFPHLAEQALAGEHSVNTFFGLDTQAWFAVVGLLVLGGVMGKSAQFPFHTWLPDAMEGPTPVSALIHAATMVAAGVYLVARMYGFYAVSPTALAVIAFVGGFTALFAATMGVVKEEIKQVLAYSTISQYGYIMLALGTGGYIAGVFHLTTHAIFKALLFLGAGSVIIAMHHNEDMWDMGGLKEKMPVTYYAFLSGSLALAGIIPFSGFWSKDEVLYEALIHGLGSPLLLGAWAMGLLAVFFTGFYTFRMVLLTFHGEPRTDAARDPHGVRWNVKGPLAVLGVLAAVVGIINLVPIEKLTGANIDFLHDFLNMESANAAFVGFHHYEELLKAQAGIEPAYIGGEIPTLLASAALSLGLALAGAGLAFALYRGPEPDRHVEKLGSIRDVLYNNYYQDEYQVWLAQNVGVGIADAANRFDQGVVDGTVNFVSSISLFSGDRLRRVQTGVVSNYAALVTLGLVLLMVAFGAVGGWF